MVMRCCNWKLEKGLIAGGLALLVITRGIAPVSAHADAQPDHTPRVQVPCVLDDCSRGLELSYLGEVSLPWNYRYQGVQFGGISGLDYDPATGHYVAITDDRSEVAPSRFYDLSIAVANDQVENITVAGATPFRTAQGDFYARQEVDPESIRLGQNGEVYWGSEGHLANNTPPRVTVSARDGRYLRSFTIPAGFLMTPDHTSGVRDNLSFEGLAFTPSGDLWASTEAPLYQDDDLQSTTHSGLVRFIRFNPQSGKAKAEYAYVVDPIPVASQASNGEADTGISDILALDDQRLLVVERSYASGYGNTVRVFAADAQAATDILNIPSLRTTNTPVVPMRKQLVLDIRALGIKPDNLEGITLGRSQEGKPLLILMADDNFNPHQKTQVLVFGIDRWPGSLAQVAKAPGKQ